MKTLSILKKDLEFNKGLSSLIEALKNIAVSQYRMLEKKIQTFEKLFPVIESFFELIDLTKINHRFINPQNNTLAVVAVTSDSGLLGGLNMQVINQALSELEKMPGKLIVVGERGKMYVRESKIPFVAFSGIKDEERYSQAIQMRDYLFEKVLSGEFGHLKVIYPKPVTFTVQKVDTLTFLPFTEPAKKFTKIEAIPDIICESDLGDIVEYIAYLWMGQKLYEVFGLSRLAEFAARFVHLEESGQKLKDIDSKTKLEYFRVRHEIIDRNMRELFAARLLFANH
jgi:ATP synthase F1 gamma subunit